MVSVTERREWEAERWEGRYLGGPDGQGHGRAGAVADFGREEGWVGVILDCELLELAVIDG